MSIACKTCRDKKILIEPKGWNARAEVCPDCQGHCSLCDDTGFRSFRDERGFDFASPCECRDNKEKVALYNQANLPGQFYDATLSNFDVKAHPSLAEALQAAKFLHRRYKSKDWRGILLMGGVGVGKTRLMVSILREFTLKHKIPCLFQEFSHLLGEIKKGYDQGNSESAILEKINQVEVLVIDELGKGRKSEWELQILDNIISNRYNMRKMTLFTTNYTNSRATTYKSGPRPKAEEVEAVKETLEERVFPRIYSRLKGMCDFIVLEGPDRRQPEHQVS